MQRVVSPGNPRLREVLRLLGSSRERRKRGRCVLEGVHLAAVYRERHGPPDTLVVTDEALAREDVRALLAHLPPAIVIAVPARLIAEHTSVPPEVGVLAVVAAPRGRVSPDARFVLMIEDVQDPGNIGSMIRTAAAAGVDHVLLSRDCAFAWSPKVLRAGQGAHFLTAVVEDVDLAAFVERFRASGGRAIATVARDGVEVYTASLGAPAAIAIGNEGAGLSDVLVACCDARVTIPMAGGSESLNAAAATAVVLFESVRQQRRGAAGA
jgi:TrmH family RNA methyltransferase